PEIEILDADAADRIVIGVDAVGPVAFRIFQCIDDPGAVLGNEEELVVGFTGMFDHIGNEIGHAGRRLGFVLGITLLALALLHLGAPEIIGVDNIEIGGVEAL